MTLLQRFWTWTWTLEQGRVAARLDVATAAHRAAYQEPA